jgi:carboxymethylenebutenolidase
VRLAVETSDSPHLVLGDVAGELYVACAEHDDYAPPEMIERFRAAMTQAGTRGVIERYAGTHHGFAFPDRGGFYDEAAAERLWARLLDLFGRRLGPPAE